MAVQNYELKNHLILREFFKFYDKVALTNFKLYQLNQLMKLLQRYVSFLLFRTQAMSENLFNQRLGFRTSALLFLEFISF